MSVTTLRRAGLAATMAAALAVTLVACGDDDGDSAATPETTSSAAPIEKDDALTALLPSSVTSDGLKIGTDASYPPNEYTDGGEIVGMDIDLGKAVGEVLGVEVTFTNSPFDAILPGIQSGKYNLGMSSFTANAERQKVVNFATYFNAGTAWAVKSGNPENIDIDNACGKRVAVQKGTVQVDDVQARSKACTDAGNDAIQINQYQLQTDVTGAVVSGKDQAMLADSPITAYAVKTAGGLELLGDTYDAAPYGIAIPCGSAGSKSCVSPYSDQPEEFANFARAIQGAVQKLIDGGQYEAILAQWGLESGAIETSEINPAS